MSLRFYRFAIKYLECIALKYTLREYIICSELIRFSSTMNRSKAQKILTSILLDI